MSALKTVFRVKLRLATFDDTGAVTWQKLVVDRPSAEEASDLIKWAYRLDEENGITRAFDLMCSVSRTKVPKDGHDTIPLARVMASLEESFSLRKA
jgi:hypothetical protein